MKKIIKTISLLALALVIMTVTTITVCADSTVTYEAEAEEFVFAPGSEYSPTDLFENFKGVMPGDSLTQTIEIKNEKSNKDTVKIYLKALGANEGSEEFLSQMTLTVKVAGGNEELFNAPANETAQLTDWVLLGTLENNASVTLDVTLNVPITVSNDFQNGIGYIDWRFKAERIEYQEPSTGPADESKTGDDFVAANYLILVFGALVAIVLVLTVRRKRTDKN